jgi:hypothetical protein
MTRLALLAGGLLLLAHAAGAGQNWQVTSFATDPQNVSKLVAATDKLLASPAGKELTGSVSLMQAVLDGADPATHSYISVFNSMAEREAWFQKMQADPAWNEFLATFAPLTDPASTSRMNTLKSWGPESDADVVWRLHVFDVSDPMAFTKALDTLMASPTGQKGPAQVYLSGVDAAGVTDFTHVISVGYESEAEAEAWIEEISGTEDWAAYLEASGKAAEFGGTFVIRTLKTWGTLPESE